MHAHPTLAESLLEAALAAEGRGIHIAGRRSREPQRALEPAAAAAGAGGGRPSASAQLEAEPAEGAASTSDGDGSTRDPDRARHDSDGSGGAGREEEHQLSRPVQETPAERPKPQPPAVQVEVSPAELKLDKKHRDELLKLHRMMSLVRRFEERTQEQYTKARIGGFCHLNIGEEATVVGGISPLKPQDYIFTSYREHGHALARGLDPRGVMAELFGKESGISRGRGGSMHMFDLEHRFMGGYGIVGGHLPLAAGVGFAIRYAKADEIVFCMFGDGASNIGAFHESLNFAKVFKLPVVWFCVNNQYGMGTAVERASAVTDMAQKSCAYDMEAARVDGMNVIEVLKKTAEFVDKTRKDHEPRLVEAITYRFRGHSVADPDKYRPAEEKDSWKRRDPILFFEADLKESKVASDDDFERIRREIDAEVDEVVKFAEQAPEPQVSDLFRYVYAADWELGGRESRRG
jgi:pyruvate dehydrogenase E1 component alpha subunit